jgi:predicted aminopeptidase
MTRMPIALNGGARISRRIVTHNHHREDFETLLADARTHFETLSQSPDDLLRHIGSPFAPDRRPTQPQALPHDRLASMLSVL